MTRIRHDDKRRMRLRAENQLIYAGDPASKPLESLKPGHVRCMICERSVSLTKTGKLRQHKDQDDIICPGSGLSFGTRVEIDELPPVVLPPKPKSNGGNQGMVTGYCHSCDKKISGERWYCGQCLRKRGRL